MEIRCTHDGLLVKCSDEELDHYANEFHLEGGAFINGSFIRYLSLRAFEKKKKVRKPMPWLEREAVDVSDVSWWKVLLPAVLFFSLLIFLGQCDARREERRLGLNDRNLIAGAGHEGYVQVLEGE